MRTIFHVDMDAFFAAIEVVRNPSLKGKPVIIGGQPDQRGVVSTCSYEARTFGVHSAMSLKEAYRRCPHAIFIEGSYRLYSEYSRQIVEIFKGVTFRVEVLSIDEAYLDVSEIVADSGGPVALAKWLQQEIFRKTQLTCSIGIAANKRIAKIASGLAKPGGIREVVAGAEKDFLFALPVQALSGVGEKTQLVLNEDGIRTVGDLQRMSLDALMERYGTRGYYFYMAAQGLDDRPVEWEDQPPKSIGAETTFERDQSEREVLVAALEGLVDKAWKGLKYHHMYARNITLKLRDSSFKTVTRSRTLLSDTQDLDVIKQETIDLFDANYHGEVPLRLLGVSLRKLTDTYWQPSFWD